MWLYGVICGYPWLYGLYCALRLRGTVKLTGKEGSLTARTGA